MRYFSFLLLLGLCQLTIAQPLLPSEAAAIEYFNKLYHATSQNPSPNVSERLNQFSQLLLRKPYLLNPLGEGPNADFDKRPRFRADGFDCETFITTLIALSLANNTDEFIILMKKIRYQSDTYQYLNRNHFTGLDWNQYNQKNGFIKDITSTILAPNNTLAAENATATINKSNWIRQTAAQRVYLPGSSLADKKSAIQKLIHKSKSIPNRISTIPYIPFRHLFDKNNLPIKSVWQQIPSGAIVEIVRPNWALQKRIGTNINVSHLGIVFWNKGVLWFRHASTEKKQVIELPLEQYLRKAQLSPTIKGINLQIVLDKPLKSTDLKH